MSMGLRFSEEEADEFIKICDPKNEGKFLYMDFVKKLLK
jgi:calmodulin